jgi:hypothetical protein
VYSLTGEVFHTIAEPSLLPHDGCTALSTIHPIERTLRAAATTTQPRERTPDSADLGGYQPPENRAGAAYLLRKLLDVSPGASQPLHPNATGNIDASSGGFAPSDDSSFVRGATAFLHSVTAGVLASPPPVAAAEAGGGGGADVVPPAPPRSAAGSTTTARSRDGSRLRSPFRRRNDGGAAAEDGESAAGGESTDAAEANAQAKAVRMGGMGRDDVSENAHVCSLSETAKVAPQHMPVLPPRGAKRVVDARRRPAVSHTLSRPSTSAAWLR